MIIPRDVIFIEILTRLPVKSLFKPTPYRAQMTMMRSRLILPPLRSSFGKISKFFCRWLILNRTISLIPRMGRSPCCEADANLKKGPWTSEEDKKLMDYIEIHGAGNWRHLPKRAGLNRCGKSCRLRWTNYLRPDIKRGAFSEEEERLIIRLHSVLGNKWSTIAAELPGRTDNEIKNYWNTHIRKKLLMMGIDPVTHRPRTNLNLLANLQSLIAAAATANFNNSSSAANPLMMNALQLQNYQLLQNLPQPSNMNLGSPYALHSLNPTLFGPNITTNENDMLAPLMRGNSCTSSTSFMSTTNSTPSLVSASPDNFSVEQTLDDLYGDIGWKDILDQIPWGNSLEQNQ